MNSTIRIIKGGTVGNPNSLPVRHAEKTDQERKRETASTVQEWISEWKERRHSLQLATNMLVRA